MKILFTGAAGYSGKGFIEPLSGHHDLRILDLRPIETPHEMVVGDVTDLDTARAASKGMDAIVIGHMAPRNGDAYSEPTIPFDVNVRGTANLFHAAVENGVKQVCLLSSINAVDDAPGDHFYARDCPRIPRDLSDYYSLTKSLQEGIAEAFHYRQNLKVSILRLGWVIDADTRIDKYGRAISKNHYALVDPRDVGEVVRRTLELPDLAFEILYVLGTPEADLHFDAAYTRELLNWTPAHPFNVD